MWHYLENNESRGPVSTEALVGLLSQRQVQGDTLIWREGMTEWTALNQTDLMDQFDAIAAAAPPVPVAVPVEKPKPKPLEFDVSKELPADHPSKQIKIVRVEKTVPESERLAAVVARGAHWFYWIAGLTALNIFLLAIKAPFSLAVGLGSPSLVYRFLAQSGTAVELPPLNFDIVLIDLVLCGLLGLFGWFSSQGNRVIFIIGTIFVFLDSLLFIFPLFSIPALIVHTVGLVMMVKGVVALGKVDEVIAREEAEARPLSLPLMVSKIESV
jgi:hypothetical protein